MAYRNRRSISKKYKEKESELKQQFLEETGLKIARGFKKSKKYKSLVRSKKRAEINFEKGKAEKVLFIQSLEDEKEIRKAKAKFRKRYGKTTDVEFAFIREIDYTNIDEGYGQGIGEPYFLAFTKSGELNKRLKGLLRVFELRNIEYDFNYDIDAVLLNSPHFTTWIPENIRALGQIISINSILYKNMNAIIDKIPGIKYAIVKYFTTTVMKYSKIIIKIILM